MIPSTAIDVDDNDVNAQALLTFVETNTVKCKERDETWHRLRKQSVGGSEIAKLLDESGSMFINERDFIKSKGLTLLDEPEEFGNVEAMNWGVFVEPVHRIMLETIFNTQILETGMAIGKPPLKYCHHSPDGVATVNTETFLNNVQLHSNWQNIAKLREKKTLNILFEEKAPQSIKVSNKVVPAYYLPQIELGLNVFECCDVGCYSSGVFRASPLNKLKYTSVHDNTKVASKFATNTIPAEKSGNPPFVACIAMRGFGDGLFKGGDISGEIDNQELQELLDSETFEQFEVGISVFNTSNNITKTTDMFKEIVENLPASASTQTQDDWINMMENSVQNNPNITFIFLKCYEMSVIAVEKEAYFGHFAGMFSILAEDGFEKCLETGEVNTQYFSCLQEFTKRCNELTPPYHSYNSFDQWFYKSRKELLTYFTRFAPINTDTVVEVLLFIELTDDENKSGQKKFVNQLKKLKTDAEWDEISNHSTMISSLVEPNILRD